MKQDQNKRKRFTEKEIEDFKEGILRIQEENTDMNKTKEIEEKIKVIVTEAFETQIGAEAYSSASWKAPSAALLDLFQAHESQIKQELIAEIKSKLPKWRVCSVQQNEESEYCTDVPYNEALSEVNEILDSV